MDTLKLPRRFAGMMKPSPCESRNPRKRRRLLCVRQRAPRPRRERQHPARRPARRRRSGSWTWAPTPTLLGYNYQQRRFADFASWDSQNWVMLNGSRRIGPGRLVVNAMFSLEPWTVGRLVYSGDYRLPPVGGTPQLYQTGESFDQIPLVNYQHPHDLFMGLGATYQVPAGRLMYFFGADLVGSPALGPTPFMHRESARSNPQVPLTHHDLDSTHIPPGVLRAGVTAGPLTFEGSVFRGAEPDENRFNIEKPALDSWSARIGWHSGPWSAQVSGGLLHEPEWFDPFDITRLTASIAFDGNLGSAVARPPRGVKIASSMDFRTSRMAICWSGTCERPARQRSTVAARWPRSISSD